MDKRDAVQFVTPLPPLRTGIAQYSRDLLRAIDGRWPIRIIAESGSSAPYRLPAEIIDVRHFDPGLPAIIQLGNSDYHRHAFEIGLRMSGIAVLHDAVLHHGLQAVHLGERRMPEYWQEVGDRYGMSGYEAGQALLHGHFLQDLVEFPLSERYIERAALTVVHNRFAERVVHDLVPGAEVIRVPMGIPLPALVSQRDARRALGWPQSAFVVASISHVNPNKRVPVVLRAIKRLAARLPETIFVIAGSRSPVVDVDRQVSALGLGDRVMVTGFVEENRARLIAAAADACVNLRHPPTGETSASLLRLLGAGKPVLVTDGVPSEDLPLDVGLRVPVDRLEEEFISELLLELANNDVLRERAGIAARRFVEGHHAMGVAVEGYRQAIRRAFGIELQALGELALHEAAPALGACRSPSETVPVSPLDRTMASMIGDLGLGNHVPTIEAVGRAMVELGLDRVPKARRDEDALEHRETSVRMKRRLACPNCHGLIGFGGTVYDCLDCGSSWSDRSGVPDFAKLVE